MQIQPTSGPLVTLPAAPVGAAGTAGGGAVLAGPTGARPCTQQARPKALPEFNTGTASILLSLSEAFIPGTSCRYRHSLFAGARS